MIEDTLKYIQEQLSSLERRLDQAEDIPKYEHLDVMFNFLDRIDEGYKEFCEQYDAEFSDEPGTSYNDPFGLNVEFYIEASDWHQVSYHLRKIREEQQKSE